MMEEKSQTKKLNSYEPRTKVQITRDTHAQLEKDNAKNTVIPNFISLKSTPSLTASVYDRFNPSQPISCIRMEEEVVYR